MRASARGPGGRLQAGAARPTALTLDNADLGLPSLPTCESCRALSISGSLARHRQHSRGDWPAYCTTRWRLRWPAPGAQLPQRVLLDVRRLFDRAR
jgi:hypothetical protein